MCMSFLLKSYEKSVSLGITLKRSFQTTSKLPKKPNTSILTDDAKVQPLFEMQ